MVAVKSKDKEQLEQRTAVVVVGIGNMCRRDDSIGLLVARALKERAYEQRMAGAHVIECSGGSFELIEAWHGADSVIVVDAVASGAAPGTLFRLEAKTRPLPSSLFHYSTHGFNVAHTIELARLLGKLPPKLVVFGIEGLDFRYGLGLSEDLTDALPRVIEAVLQCVGEPAGNAPNPAGNDIGDS
jgi:hydrogenase maturation protease